MEGLFNILNYQVVIDLINLGIWTYFVKILLDFFVNYDGKDSGRKAVGLAVVLVIGLSWKSLVENLLVPILSEILNLAGAVGAKAKPVSTLVVEGKLAADKVFGLSESIFDRNLIDRAFFILQFVLKNKVIAPLFGLLGTLALAVATVYALISKVFIPFFKEESRIEAVKNLVHVAAGLTAVGVLNPSLVGRGSENNVDLIFAKIEEEVPKALSEFTGAENTAGISEYISAVFTATYGFTYYHWGPSTFASFDNPGKPNTEASPDNCKLMGGQLFKNLLLSENILNDGPTQHAIQYLSIEQQLNGSGAALHENNGLFMPLTYQRCSYWVVVGLSEAIDEHYDFLDQKTPSSKAVPPPSKALVLKDLSAIEQILDIVSERISRTSKLESDSLNNLKKSGGDSRVEGGKLSLYANNFIAYNNDIRNRAIDILKIYASENSAKKAEVSASFIDVGAIITSGIVKLSAKADKKISPWSAFFPMWVKPYANVTTMFIVVAALFLMLLGLLSVIPLLAAKAYMMFVVKCFLLPIAAFLLLPVVVIPGETSKILGVFFKVYLPKAFYVSVFMLLMTPVMAILSIATELMFYVINGVG